jgi:hypothetical protein
MPQTDMTVINVALARFALLSPRISQSVTAPITTQRPTANAARHGGRTPVLTFAGRTPRELRKSRTTLPQSVYAR